MDDIKAKMDKWIEGCNVILTSYAAVEKLKSQGLQFDVVPADSVGDLFEKKKQAAVEIIEHLPPIPEDLDLPHAVKSLYQEILECILCGLNGAAITLSGNLIEFVIKHVTFIREQGGYHNYDPNKWDEFEAMDLSSAIGRAKKHGLLDGKMAKRLSEFREDIRNPYSHFNIKKITEHVVAGKVKVVDFENGTEETRDIEAKSDPAIQALVKPFVDGRNVLNVFWFTNEVIRYLVNRMVEMEKKSAAAVNKEELTLGVNRFCDYFLGQLEAIPSNATRLQKKIILSCLIDTLGRAAFPSEGNQRTRFLTLINTFGAWDLRNQVSMQQALLRLTERKLTKCRLFEHLTNGLATWQTGNIIPASTDPSLDELLNLIDSDQEKKVVQGCLHTELFYQYRNRLVHELREPGYGIEMSDDDQQPYYHSESSGVWQLVYPEGLFYGLARQAIENLRAHWIKCGVSPYDSFHFGSVWADK